jgi:tetratricopeptide (TPR) repeat protein
VSAGRVRSAGVVAAILLMAATARAQDAATEARIEEGVRHHDAGRYDAAVAAHRGVLKDHPGHPRATYELAYSLLAKEDTAGVVGVLEASRGTPGMLPRAYSLLGIAYDAQRKWTQAEAAFRDGLTLAPDSIDLHFNLGVNLDLGQGKVDEGIASYQQALRRNDRHAGSWLRLAQAEERRGRLPRAFVGFVRFLAVEPTSQRSPEGLAGVLRLWQAGVAADAGKDGKRNITITVPSPTEIGEQPASEAMAFALAASTRHLEANEAQPDVAAFGPVLDRVVAILYETTDGKPEAAFAHEALRPLEEARAASHLAALAWDIRRSSGDPAVARWLEENAAAVDRYRVWDLSRPPSGTGTDTPVSPRP